MVITHLSTKVEVSRYNYPVLESSIPEQNDSTGVVLSTDRITPLESFYPRTE